MLANALDHPDASWRLRLVYRKAARPKTSKAGMDLTRELLEVGEFVANLIAAGEKYDFAIASARKRYNVSGTKAKEGYSYWTDAPDKMKNLLDLIGRTTENPKSR